MCISAGAVERAAAPGRLRRNAPDVIPVAIIGRLAVDLTHAGQSLGADLLADALHRIARAAQSIGIAAIFIHAKTDAAKRFYLRCAEFMAGPIDDRMLFLPVEAVSRASGKEW